MATATTLNLVIENYVSLIKAITPNLHTAAKFDRCQKDHRLRAFAEKNKTTACLRKFEIVRTSGAESAPFCDPSAVEIAEIITVTVAYPTDPAIYRVGSTPDSQIDMDDLIRRDARDIRDVLFSPGNRIAGQLGVPEVPVIKPLEYGEGVLFQEIDATVFYTEGMSIY